MRDPSQQVASRAAGLAHEDFRRRAAEAHAWSEKTMTVNTPITTTIAGQKITPPTSPLKDSQRRRISQSPVD
jgi:hypothetical protein